MTLRTFIVRMGALSFEVEAADADADAAIAALQDLHGSDAAMSARPA